MTTTLTREEIQTIEKQLPRATSTAWFEWRMKQLLVYTKQRDEIIDAHIAKYNEEGSTSYSKMNVAIELIEALIKLKGESEDESIR